VTTPDTSATILTCLHLDPGRLRTARMAAGYTGAEAATALGLGRATIASYETGLRVPPGNTLIRLAFLYRTPVENLCTADTSGTPE